MQTRFLALHAVAVTLHLLCGVYAFSSPHVFTTPLPVELKRVRYGDDLVYYEITDILELKIPSVIAIHGIVAFITIAFHLILYVPSHLYYAPVIWRQGFFAVRWVEYSLTCTLMSIASMASAGVDDATTLLGTVVLGFALQSLGALIEQRKDTVYFLVLTGGLINLGFSVGTIWLVTSSTGIYAPQVIEFVSYAFYYGLFPLNCIADAVYREGRFVRTDWLYNVLSVTSKVGLFWLQVGEVERNLAENRTWPDVQVFGLGVVAPLVLLAVGVWYAPDNSVPQSSTPPSTPPSTLLGRLITFRVVPPPRVKVVTETKRQLVSVQSRRLAR